MEIKEPKNNAQSFGALLKKQREKKKIKIDQVSQELFIKKRQIEALEIEDFDNLPQYTFARGFAIKYAQYLEMDEKEIAQKFDATFPQEHRTTKASDIQAPLRPMGTLTRDSRTKINLNPWLIFGLIAVVVLAVFFIRIVSNAEKEQKQPQIFEQEINIEEQQQGAYIDGSEVESDGMSSSGSAINLD